MKIHKIWRLVAVLAVVLVMAGCGTFTPSASTATTGGFPTSSEVTEMTVPTTVPGEAVPPATTRPPATAPTEPTTIPTTNQTPVISPTEATTIPTEPTEATTPPTITEQPEHPTTMPTVPPTTATTVPSTVPPIEPTAPNGGVTIPNAVTVTAPGELVKSKGNVIIDYSNTKNGYVMVCHTAATEHRLKVQVKGPTTTYTYDLIPKEWIAFPLSDGNGSYRITVLQNVSGTTYALMLSLNIEVVMTDEFAPFLRSNQYVNFDAAPHTVAQAATLVANHSDPLEKVAAVYNYVVSNLTYDKQLAATVRSGYLPVLDTVLSKKSGICFDYAALMTGMLRSQGVPTKLVVGYAGETYHAWIHVWSEETGWINGVIYFNGVSWERMDPTFASSGGGSSDIMDYIGDGKNYTAKYFY